jgi:hypothetical protein
MSIFYLEMAIVSGEESKGTDGETPRRGIPEGEGVQDIQS